jgi:hypothetical protein
MVSNSRSDPKDLRRFEGIVGKELLGGVTLDGLEWN